MTTLIGRECWHVSGVLRHGKIVRHDMESAIVTIDCGASGQAHIHPSQALITPRAALHEAEEARDYWARKVEELEILVEEMDG